MFTYKLYVDFQALFLVCELDTRLLTCALVLLDYFFELVRAFFAFGVLASLNATVFLLDGLDDLIEADASNKLDLLGFQLVAIAATDYLDKVIAVLIW